MRGTEGLLSLGREEVMSYGCILMAEAKSTRKGSAGLCLVFPRSPSTESLTHALSPRVDTHVLSMYQCSCRASIPEHAVAPFPLASMRIATTCLLTA